MKTFRKMYNKFMGLKPRSGKWSGCDKKFRCHRKP